ncbi:tetratricopeptide repeat protein [Hyalangium rubrum]|uniref:Tetratricopeptide repeat protein n=1 Tax=Hyalangium rubrum TaxID=3103134 RepID=A0ABU5HHJ7_9BACT|nr:tetratricopeptide repeat protein [Hyalangium sp. s54d21]MDY7232711.1 tetratricopeptide repeat protein [Hyalangium sp. s54d21]
MRGFKLWLGGVALAGLTLGAVPADASVKVIGRGEGRLCYEYAKTGHSSEPGIESCTRALTEQALTPEDRAATFVNRGILHMYAKDFARALTDYEEAITLKPSLADAYVNKGVALVNLGRDAEAVTAIGQALELNTVRPEIAYYTRGIANEMLGNMREAYNDYRQAVALKPEWKEPQAQLRRFAVVPKNRG